MENLISVLLIILGIYLLVGFLFGILFAFFGVKAVDAAAQEGTLGFKIIIIPGCAIFWPYLLKRWAGKTQPPEETSAHRRAAKS